MTIPAASYSVISKKKTFNKKPYTDRIKDALYVKIGKRAKTDISLPRDSGHY